MTSAEALQMMGSGGFGMMSAITFVYILWNIHPRQRGRRRLWRRLWRWNIHPRQRGLIVCATTMALVIGTAAALRLAVLPLHLLSLRDAATLNGMIGVIYLGAQIGGLLRVHRDA